MEKTVTLVTREGCPYCQKAKSILDESLGGKYNSQITFIEQNKDQEAFDKLQSQYHFQTVPTFIDQTSGEVLSSSQQEAITKFVEQHLAGENLIR